MCYTHNAVIWKWFEHFRNKYNKCFKAYSKIFRCVKQFNIQDYQLWLPINACLSKSYKFWHEQQRWHRQCLTPGPVITLPQLFSLENRWPKNPNRNIWKKTTHNFSSILIAIVRCWIKWTKKHATVDTPIAYLCKLPHQVYQKEVLLCLDSSPRR